HRVVPVENCLIEDKKSQEIIRTIRGLLKSFKIKTYDEDTGYGLFRHVLIRRGFKSGEIMVVLVLGSPILPSSNNFVKALRKEHPEITTVVLNINDRKTSMILGEREKVLYGKGFIRDELCGCTFRISPKSFYQVNPVQTEILYQKAIEFAHLTGKESVIDAYCGIGTIGLIASGHAKEVVGVELNKDAVKDAILNAKENQIRNVRFFQGDAGEFMEAMAAEGNSMDVLFMDPPRAGSDEKFMASAVKMGPEKIVYISCSPETLARDLKYLTKKGYQVKKIQPVEMFAFTEHVETVVLLSHKKPDSHINIKVEFGEGEGKVPLKAIAERAEAYKPKERVTYKMIKEYIEAKYGFKVHTAYIAEVKRDLGLPMYDAPNAVEELKNPRKHPTAEKVEAIKDALKYFEVI
uniref:23S rRNA (uracil(1939)-C(5))-methyltransferase RlmD n=1 Tax=Coprococcus comes TaxID=410072 RepID=UPI0034A4D3C5